MRSIERLPENAERSLARSNARDARLVDYLVTAVEDAYSARHEQEDAWEEQMRQYAAVPKTPYRHVPIENAPNLEIPIGAINVDDLWARMLELIFSANPILTARGRKGSQDLAKAVQTWTNEVVTTESQLRPAAEQVLLDDCMLGTGVYYVPWIVNAKKTDVYTVREEGPRIMAVPPEDFLTPGGAMTDIDRTQWCAMRSYYGALEIADRLRKLGWSFDGKAIRNDRGRYAGVLTTTALSPVRQRREALGRTRQNTRLADLYELHDVYVRMDYDGDGVAEDLLAIWDRTSRKLLWLDYQPYDWRPFEAIRYQLQPYLFNGLGIMELCRPIQDGVSEATNAWSLNVFLANCREWIARTGTLPDGEMVRYPGKVHEVNNPEDLKELKMSDEYASALAHIEFLVSLAQQRTGNNWTQQQRPISTSRTSGVTAMSFLQQQNRRFTGAFDSARLGTSAAARQCLYRYREQLLAGNMRAEHNITRVMGEAAAPLTSWLKSDGFEEDVQVELTASSASINRDQDRQNALQLANLYSQYYQQAFQTLAIAANPQTPAPVRQAAQKVSEKAYELMDMVSRTFDLIARDPSVALADLQPEYQMIEQQAQQGQSQIQQLLMSAMQQGQQKNGGGGPTPQDLPGPASPLPNSGAGAI